MGKTRCKVVNMLIEGKSVKEIADECHITRSYVYKLAGEENIEVIKQRQEKNPKAVISEDHLKFGVFIHNKRWFENNKTTKEVEETGITSTRLNAIERGTYDIKLSELKILADYYGINLASFF